MKSVFEEATVLELVNRLQALTPETKPYWGKMSVDQMLAHCNVTYAFEFEPEKFKRPTGFKKFLLKTLVKKYVVSEKPYKQNSMTSPEFIIADAKIFEDERLKLISNIQKVQQLGFKHFDGKENFSFGRLNGNDWNILFYKHLDHHLNQFGV